MYNQPLKVYFNLMQNKKTINQEQKGKAGIYPGGVHQPLKWKTYLGSSKQLSRRFKRTLFYKKEFKN